MIIWFSFMDDQVLWFLTAISQSIVLPLPNSFSSIVVPYRNLSIYCTPFT